MSLTDIDGLSDSPTPGQGGHREDHGKISRGLKALKSALSGKLEVSGTPSSDKVVSYSNGSAKWQKTGEVAYASSSAQFVSSSTSPVDLPGMEVTFATEDRPVMLDLCIQLVYSGADGIACIEIYDGSEVLATGLLMIRGFYGTAKVSIRIPAGTPSKTYKGRFWQVTGGAEANFEMTPSNPPSLRYMQAVTI